MADTTDGGTRVASTDNLKETAGYYSSQPSRTDVSKKTSKTRVTLPALKNMNKKMSTRDLSPLTKRMSTKDLSPDTKRKGY